jgi:hypothetical protein
VRLADKVLDGAVCIRLDATVTLAHSPAQGTVPEPELRERQPLRARELRERRHLTAQTAEEGRARGGFFQIGG